MNPHWQLYKELELIPDSVPEPGSQSDLIFRFEQVWNSISNIFTPDYEPDVWQTVDREGEDRWCVYETHTRRTLYFESEDELRNWLNQYYGIG
jgi:hypothetical protein